MVIPQTVAQLCGLRILRLRGKQPSQVAECLRMVKAPVARFKRDASSLLDRRSQLHAPQAVQVQVFGQAQFVPRSRRRLA